MCLKLLLLLVAALVLVTSGIIRDHRLHLSLCIIWKSCHFFHEFTVTELVCFLWLWKDRLRTNRFYGPLRNILLKDVGMFH